MNLPEDPNLLIAAAVWKPNSQRRRELMRLKDQAERAKIRAAIDELHAHQTSEGRKQNENKTPKRRDD